jgi:uncharacterized protein
LTADHRSAHTCGMKAEFEALRGQIRPLLEDKALDAHTMYLYGSRADGTANAESDYDFALIADRALDRSELGFCRETLSELIPGKPDIDCVDMRRIPLTLAAQILGGGVVLYCRDELERARLETRLMSMYASLNEERQGILDDIVERGSVYAR